MSWTTYLQLGIAAAVGGGLAYLLGDRHLLGILATGIVVAVLHSIPVNAIVKMRAALSSEEKNNATEARL